MKFQQVIQCDSEVYLIELYEDNETIYFKRQKIIGLSVWFDELGDLTYKPIFFNGDYITDNRNNLKCSMYQFCLPEDIQKVEIELTKHVNKLNKSTAENLKIE